MCFSKGFNFVVAHRLFIFHTLMGLLISSYRNVAAASYLSNNYYSLFFSTVLFNAYYDAGYTYFKWLDDSLFIYSLST